MHYFHISVAVVFLLNPHDLFGSMLVVSRWLVLRVYVDLAAVLK